jgi:hypothetical protein
MPTYTPLQSIQLASSSANVIFSNIPQNYQDLVIVLSVRGTTATNDIDVSATFNGDSSSVYSNTRMYGDGSSAGPQRGTGLGYARLGNMTGSGSFATYTPIIFHILNYSNTSVLKSTIGRSNNPNRIIDLYANLWRSTSAINSVTITGSSNFDAGCTFDLYGISPVAAQNAQASGGTEIYYDSSYVYHVFKGSGTFTPYRNLTADILVVAGGGAGGADASGGGGAGGLLGFNSQSLTSSTNYSVIVGGGGARTTSGNGNTGNDSRFGSLTLVKGGGGGGTYANNGQNGGSGGGAGGISGGGTLSGGTATPSGQGNNGGGRSGGTSYGAGGGGGAGATGSPSVSGNGGNGGNGSSSYSSWGLATSTGENVGGTYYYAGGGGGGTQPGQTVGSGGYGGGSAGTLTGIPNNATPFTGGGGGGTTFSGAQNSGAGGSGIVIVRYAR